MRDLSVFLDDKRLTSYLRLAALVYCIGFLALFLNAKEMVDSTGKPLGYDFITFWSAARVSLDGNPAGAFDFRTIFEAQKLAVPANKMLFAWHYPPTFQLAVLPLALMPYLLSYFVFVALTLAAFVFAMRPLIPWRETAVLLFALPGTFICVAHGQNSMFSAALLATAVACLRPRPVLAGVCIGLLAYKPQLGMLFPIVLAITGNWRAFFAAGTTVAIYAGTATLVFGTDLWRVFFENLSLVRELLETRQLPWAKIPSAFIFLRMLGVPAGAAYAAQAAVALAAIAVTVAVWWRVGATLMAGATLIAATMLLSPYTFDYEMAIMAVPLAIIARHLLRRGASDREKFLLLFLAVSPIGMGTIVDKVGVQFGFVLLVVLLGWTVRLALVERGVSIVNIPAGLRARIVGASS